MTTHVFGQKYICEQSIADDHDLRGIVDLCIAGTEVLQNLILASRFLNVVSVSSITFALSTFVSCKSTFVLSLASMAFA